MICKQIYHPYWIWEDYINGMYKTENIENKDTLIKYCISLFSSETEFYDSALEMVLNWNYASDVNLTNVSINRRAWIGRATCNYLYGSPEIITRIAWNETEVINQKKSNNIADKVIRIYEEKNKSIYKNMGTEMLF